MRFKNKNTYTNNLSTQLKADKVAVTALDIHSFILLSNKSYTDLTLRALGSIHM